MRSVGIVRPVDDGGRVVIPSEMRKLLKIEENVDSVEVFMEGNRVIMQKYQPTCVFCDSLIDIVQYEGYNICKSCIEKLYAIKDSAE